MKKYNILFIAFIIVLFCSCNDFLDNNPEGEYEKESLDYSKIETMFNPVSGVYATARSYNGFGRWALYGLIAVRSADIEKGGSPTDQAEYTDCKNFEYSKIDNFWGLNYSWEGLYYLVQVCNSSLEMLGQYAKHTTTDADKKLNLQYQAEVRFIRAYAYFYLVRLWGEIPIIRDNTDILNTEKVSKVPVAEVYKFIDEELDFCVNNMPALRPNEMPYKGQATQYSAWALRAKVNADINDWDKVLIATNKIYDSQKFTLFDDFYQYFKKPGMLADETFFELQYSDANSADIIASDSWFEFQGPKSITGVNDMKSGWGFMVPTQYIIDLFTRRGETVRAETSFLYTGKATPEGDVVNNSSVGEPTVYNGKAYLPSTQLTPGRIDYGSGNNIRMLRYGDILLLNAEAKVRSGQSGDTPFNLVRKRAKMPELTNVTLEQILEEREVELCGEWGESYFDLLRTGKAADVLPNFVKGKSEYYPIPLPQKDMNPNL